MANLKLEIIGVDTKANRERSALSTALLFGNDFAHGCNTYGSMEAGIAGQVSERVPSLQKLDSVTCADKGASLMGEFIQVKVGGSRVANFYTQMHPGSGSLSYEAIQSCFEKWIAFEGRGSILYIPAIGCGIAGGDRSSVTRSILSAFKSSPQESKALTVRMIVWDPTEPDTKIVNELIAEYESYVAGV